MRGQQGAFMGTQWLPCTRLRPGVLIVDELTVNIHEVVSAERLKGTLHKSKCEGSPDHPFMQAGHAALVGGGRRSIMTPQLGNVPKSASKVKRVSFS